MKTIIILILVLLILSLNGFNSIAAVQKQKDDKKKSSKSMGIIESFTLVDPLTGSDIRTLNEFDTIYTGTPYNIRVNTEGKVRSVIIKFGDEDKRTDNELPFTVGGDKDGQYQSWLPPKGTFILTATPFKNKNAHGKKGNSVSIKITVLPELPPSTQTSYVELNNLLVIYKNSNKGSIPDNYATTLNAALAELNKFYWRHSQMTLNIKWTVYVIEDYLERVHDPGAFVIPTEVDADLRSRGFQVDTYDAVGVAIRGGGAYAYGVNQVLGRAGYFQVPWKEDWWGDKWLFPWFFVHEFHHVLDAMFDKSGYPLYPHNHPGAARAQGEYLPHSGTGWDLNAEILHNWERSTWFDLIKSGNWGIIKSSADKDSDTIPDIDPNVPLDELRFGSNPSLADSDKDGVPDLQEALAGIFTLGDPLNADSDRDGIPELTDPEPIYPVNTWVPLRSNLALTQDVTQWPLAGRYFFDKPDSESSSIHLAYSSGNLYLGIKIPTAANKLSVFIDANNDGLFYGKDNLEIILDVNTINQVKLYDAASVPPSNNSDHIVSDLPTTGFSGVTRSGSGWTSFQLTIPKLPAYGLELANGETIGININIPGYGQMFEPDDYLTVKLGENESGTLAKAPNVEDILGSQPINKFIYPNPAQKKINIRLDEAGTLRIVNIRGEECINKKITSAGTAHLDIESLSPGLYLLYLETPTGKKSYKFLKN